MNKSLCFNCASTLEALPSHLIHVSQKSKHHENPLCNVAQTLLMCCAHGLCRGPSTLRSREECCGFAKALWGSAPAVTQRQTCTHTHSHGHTYHVPFFCHILSPSLCPVCLSVCLSQSLFLWPCLFYHSLPLTVCLSVCLSPFLPLCLSLSVSIWPFFEVKLSKHANFGGMSLVVLDCLNFHFFSSSKQCIDLSPRQTEATGI